MSAAASMRGMTAIALTATAALLSACATSAGLAPRVRLRGAEHLAASRSLHRARVDGRWPSPRWWSSFGDPQLDRLIEQGLATSPTLQQAEARTRLALAAAHAAQSARLPHLGVSGSTTRERYPQHWIVPPPYGGAWTTQNALAASLQFALDFWGRYRSAYELKLDASRAAELDAAAARVALSTTIAQAYVTLERAYLERRVERQLLAERTRIDTLTLQREHSGIDSMLDVKQAQSEIPAARERITQLDETIALARNALAALIGRGPDHGLTLTRPQLARRLPPALPSRLPADLLGRRPDLLALRWRISAAAHGIASAKAAFYPNVSLTALAGFEALGSGALFTAANREFGVGPALSLPIFDGGRLRANLERRDAQYDLAVSRYNQALANALRDVVDQIDSLRSIASQRAELRTGLATAHDAYQLALLRYCDGLGNYLQVLATHTQWLAQRQLDVALRARDWSVSINLVRALGGGYVPPQGALQLTSRIRLPELNTQASQGANAHER